MSCWWILAGRTDFYTHTNYTASQAGHDGGTEMLFNLCEARELSLFTEISSLRVNLRWNRHCSHCIPDLFVTYPWFNHSGIHRRRPLVRLQNIKQHRQQLEEAATCALTRSSIWSPRFRWCTVVCVRLYGNVSCTGFSCRLFTYMEWNCGINLHPWSLVIRLRSTLLRNSTPPTESSLFSWKICCV